MFLQTASIAAQINEFRSGRLKLIEDNVGPIPLAQTALDKIVLHIMPASAFSYSPTLSMSLIQDKNAFKPISADGGWSPRFNVDGFINERGGEACHGYTQVFRTGCIEATKVRILGQYNDTVTVPARRIEILLLEPLASYLKGLTKLGASPPFYIAISLLNVKGAVVITGTSWALDSNPRPIQDRDMILPVCVIDDYDPNGNYRHFLRPALDALWNAGDRSGWTATEA
jgi:hypothetical protein